MLNILLRIGKHQQSLHLHTLKQNSVRCYAVFPFFTPTPPRKTPKTVTAQEAVKVLKSGNTVHIQGAAATPIQLINALTEFGKGNKLKDIKICHMHTEGKAPYCDPSCAGIFRTMNLFMGGNVRQAVAEGRAGSIPVFLSDIPNVFYRGVLKPDIVLLHVSPPDKHGYVTMGTSVDCCKAPMAYAKTIIAQVNKKMPRIFGDGVLHLSEIDYLVDVDTPLPSHPSPPPDKEETQIGKFVAEQLVKNGSTLQMGIGKIPDAVLAALGNHKDLGIHSEMFADGVIDLVKKGCVNNNMKVLDRGFTVGSFLNGTQKLYDFADDNPSVLLKVVDYVNGHSFIIQQPKMVAINSCLEIDLTGQVVADSIGTKMFSGFGGQVDFIRAAGDSLDGQGVPIIAVQSQTKKGKSKIVPLITPGAGVVTSRAHCQFVVTEYGGCNLFGKELKQRARALIDIAHPNHRESLEKAAFERLKVMPSL